jgi:tRNA A-37 threonylcarbamoyl transferase component Bud32
MENTGVGGDTKPEQPDSAFSIDAVQEDFPNLEILEVIGRGGMGVVYKARQKSLDRMVALKVLAPRVKDDPAFAERFQREARALARLCHQNIVAIHDFGQVSGRCYFVMEYVDGISLREALCESRLSPEEALAIVPAICDALQYAHDEGIVHRDIKPENLLIDRRGHVKIADFGLAKILVPDQKDFSLTGTRDVMGTPHYMAPEQFERPSQVDHRADIYALGVVFYEMLTGELPIGRFAPPSRKVQVDVRLDDVVLRTLEREPDRRYQQASHLKMDVESISFPGKRSGTGAQTGSGAPPRVPPSPDDLERAHRLARLPAVGILLAGAVNVGYAMLVLAVETGWYDRFSRWFLPASWAQAIRGWIPHIPDGFAWVLIFFFLLFGCGLIYGTVRMLTLRSHRGAIRTCVCAMLPVHPGVIIGFWFGLLGLISLTRPDVAGGFPVREEPGLFRRFGAFVRRNRWAVATLMIGIVIAAAVLIAFRAEFEAMKISFGAKNADQAFMYAEVDESGLYSHSVDAGSRNLLSNGGFEGLDQWTISHAEPGYSVDIDPDPDHKLEGMSSLRMQRLQPGRNRDDGCSVSQEVLLTPTVTSVRVTGWVKCAVSGRARVAVRSGGTGESAPAQTWFGTIPAWSRFSVDCPVPPGTDSIEVVASMAGTGRVWFDDFQLKAVNVPWKREPLAVAVARPLGAPATAVEEVSGRGPNLLRDGGFGSLKDWTIAYSHPNCLVDLDTETKHGGNTSLRMRAYLADDACTVSQTVTLDTTIPAVRLTGWMLGDIAGQVIVQVKDEREGILYSRGMRGRREWVKFTADCVVSGARQVEISIGVWGRGPFNMDDLELAPLNLRSVDKANPNVSALSGTAGPFRVVVADRVERDAADALQKRLSAEGYTPVLVINSAGKYAVVLGAFPDRGTAQAALGDLTRQGYKCVGVSPAPASDSRNM